MSVIFNTTVVSNFASVDQLDCLRFLFQRIWLPLTVYEEILSGLEEGYTFFDGITDQIFPFDRDG